ncbi:alpha/beta fold hydrolase [Natronoglycomyces albus]|uniref:Alpha/beta hydrolase n=1 Tax=Natronoglycomyces albus TaxID=2811108 RepID=A0A895XJC6_9ACTN|nr:alpha/beta hydrolase [Natronoglycomyces albus]QSB03912.1 alpha/beta hydrolase [Natronoglycomyces albus]
MTSTDAPTTRLSPSPRPGTRAYPWLRRAALVTAILLSARVLIGLIWFLGLGVPSAQPGFSWFSTGLITLLCAAVVVAILRWARFDMALLRHRLAFAIPLLLTAGLLYGAYGWQPAAQDYQADEVPGPPSHYVDTDLARFHYTDQGEGPPVVLLSPGAAWTMAWQPQAAYLAQTHRVVVVDLPGQGFTQLREDDFAFDLPAMSSAIDAFLESLDLRGAHLGGMSWSAGWALHYASENPENVNRLMLLAPSGVDEPDILTWRLLEPPIIGELVSKLSAVDRSSYANMVADMFAHQDQVTDEVIDAMWKPNTFANNIAATTQLQRGLDWRLTEAAMPDLPHPTLVLWGEEDSVLSVDLAQTFETLIPNSVVHRFSDCGHALTLDCSAEVNTAMAEFLT